MKQWLCAWGVRVVAIFDALHGVVLLAVVTFLPISSNDDAGADGRFAESSLLAVLCIALGLTLFALDRYEWTRPAGILTVIFQVAGVTVALGYLCLKNLFN